MPQVSEAKLQGFEDREVVEIDARRWQGIRRQLIRLVLGFRYADKEAARILETCKHAPGCPAVGDRTRPCLQECPDREIHLSALVIKHNAEQYILLQRGLPLRPDGEYSPPSRETYDAVVSELEMLREAGDLLTRLENLATAGADARGGIPSPWADPNTIGLPPGAASATERPISKLVPVGQEDPIILDDDGSEDDTERPPAPEGSSEGLFDPHGDSPDHRLIRDGNR